MNVRLRIFLWLILLDYFGYTQDSSGFTDENRPYKFGFNIEGYQHRYEEKDEKGIIMGEYGFVTGDGVYHLTVYATDENGNFRIVRTKNIYIGLPGEKTTTPVPAATSLRPERVKEIIKDEPNVVQGIAGCGGCVIPTTSAPQAVTNKGVSPIRADTQTNNLIRGSLLGEQEKTFTKPLSQVKQDVTNTLADPNIPSNPQHKLRAPYKSLNYPDNVAHKGSLDVQEEMKKTYGHISSPIDDSKMNPNAPQQKTMTNLGHPSFQKPMNMFTNMTDKIRTMEDLQDLFYLFNYTLTYHGHSEYGDRAGNKNGSFFFNGRDGLGRNVTYIANEFGYQPNITLYNLTPEDTPKEDSEKNATKLLTNEFRWFYGNGNSHSAN